MKKQQVCQAIVVAKCRNDLKVASGMAKAIKPETNLPSHFVTLSFINVLSGEVMKPLIAHHGRVLNQNELQVKLKTNEILQRKPSLSTTVIKECMEPMDFLPWVSTKIQQTSPNSMIS